MYKYITRLFLVVCLGALASHTAQAADPNSYINRTESQSAQSQAITIADCLPPYVIVGDSCSSDVRLGWVAFGGLPRWETRIMISGLETRNTTSCIIHATVKVYDPNPLPMSGGTLASAKQLFVNYIDNRGGNSDRNHPRTSGPDGISYDLKNGESVNLTLLSGLSNPLVTQGGSLGVNFTTTSTYCQNWRVPMEVNYLLWEESKGYTFNVFQSELVSGSALKWFVSAEGSPQDSPNGFVDMSVNVFNPSLTGTVMAHIEAYDQFGRCVAFTGTGCGGTSSVPDHQLGPMATWSTLLRDVLGSAITNFTGRIYISSTSNSIMVTAYRRDDMGMSAPVAVMTPF